MTDPPQNPLDRVAPLQKLLAAHGVQAGLWAIVEVCGDDLSLNTFATCARHHGLDSFVFQLTDGDLSFLAVGTLVELRGGAIATLVAHDADGVVLERSDGSRQHVGKTSDVKGVMALDVRPTAGDDDRLLVRLGKRLRAEPHAKRGIVVAGFLALVLMGVSLATPMITRAVIGHALPNRAPHELRLLALVFTLVGGIAAYVGWLRRRALLYLSTKLSEIASIDVVAHALSLPFARLSSLDIGGARQAVRSATSAAEAIPTLVPQFVDAVLGIGLLAYAFTLDPRSAAITAVGGIVTIVLGILNARRRLSMRRELMRLTRREEQGLYETIVGVETVKTESIEGRMLARWLDRLLVEEKAALDLRLAAGTLSTVMNFIERGVFGAVLLANADRCISTGAPIADLVATLQASLGFMMASQKLAQLPVSIVNFRTDVERADNVLEESREKKGWARRPADTVAPALLLRDVWFRYDAESPWVLTGMNLVVRPDEVVMLTWPSGAGKSTLLRILAGLLPPTRGDALVFGIEATQARRMVCYIPQQATLFPGSLMENLRILSGSSTPERILDAAKATGLLALVATWPMGLDTIVSLGAANVSSGQRQLVLFTAAVASEAPIVLLDEALAHVDLAMRARLGVVNLFKGRTIVSVVHDASPREVSHARLIPLIGVQGHGLQLPGHDAQRAPLLR